MEENYNEEDNIVILNDEDGNEVKFEFLDLVELDDEEYVVLLPVTAEGEEDEGQQTEHGRSYRGIGRRHRGNQEETGCKRQPGQGRSTEKIGSKAGACYKFF